MNLHTILDSLRVAFSKRIPAPARAASLSELRAWENRSLAVFMLIFILLAAGLVVIGYGTYRQYESRFRSQMDGQLTAIAALKVNQLESWRAERRDDANIFYNNPVFATLAQTFLENPGDAQAEAQLRAWLGAVQTGEGYERVSLLDTNGVERMASPVGPQAASATLAGQAAAALEQGQITFMDFYRDAPSGPIRLALLVPVYAGGERSQPLGVVALSIDPGITLYPFIREWPAPSSTAETLLVRQDGNDALFLNELRFQPNAALSLRIPLTDTRVLAVQAVLGRSGIVEGVDYRGLAAIGYVATIPDSPWFLVASMDTAEVYAPLRERMWQTILFFGVLILAAGAGLLMLWRQQGLHYYRAQVEALEKISASERRFRSLFENMLNGFAYCRMIFEDGHPQDFLYLEVNRTFETLTGLQDVVGKKVSEVVPGIRESDPELLERYGRVALTGNPEAFEIYLEALKMWFSISVYSPQKEYFVAVFDVITDRKRAEQELKIYTEHLMEMVAERTREVRQAQEKLIRQERLATLGQLAGSVSHELRNPLGVISNAVYFLKLTQPDASETIKEYLDIIEKETRTSDKIVTDLLDFTRIKAVERERVDVSTLLRQTLQRHPVSAPLEVALEIPPDLPPVLADPQHIVQVLGNLVANACQAMEDPQSTSEAPLVMKLTLSASLHGDMIEIAVQDTGAGIPPENMGKLFEPLFTTKTKGIGLGLAVSQKLAEANGGHIEARSQLGQGSTFTVILPVYKEENGTKTSHPYRR